MISLCTKVNEKFFGASLWVLGKIKIPLSRIFPNGWEYVCVYFVLRFFVGYRFIEQSVILRKDGFDDLIVQNDIEFVLAVFTVSGILLSVLFYISLLRITGGLSKEDSRWFRSIFQK